jgi:hypothetical protein
MTTRVPHPRLAVVFAAILFYLFFAGVRISHAALPQPGDIAFGLSSPDATLAVELVRGAATINGGTKLTSPWQSAEFIQSVKFDNYGGVRHNVHGNLIGVDFGAPSDTGKIYSLATTVDPSPTPPQKIGDTLGIGGAGLSLNRLAGLSVSPTNSRISLTGYTTGAVIVYDYVPGDTMGGGASLSGARQTPNNTVDAGHSQGTAWNGDDTFIVFGSRGKLIEVNSTSMATTLKTTLPTPSGLFANYTSLAYEPSISPYLYALWGGFDGEATENKLYVVDPANSYGLVKQIDLSTSLQTGREVALDRDGNLFMSQYGGMDSGGGVDPDGAKIDFIPASMVLNPSTLTDNSSINWYISTTLSSFSSIDIGFGPAAPTPLIGDYNNDMVVNAADYTVWRDNLGADGSTLGSNRDSDNMGAVSSHDYDSWKAHFGEIPGGGAAAVAVPEPAGLTLLVAMVSWCSVALPRKRR